MQVPKLQADAPHYSSLQTLVSDSVSLIEEVLSTDLQFQNEFEDHTYLVVRKHILNFQKQLLHLYSILVGKESPDIDLNCEYNLKIRSKDEICEKVVLHYFEFIHKNLLEDLLTQVHIAREQKPCATNFDQFMIIGPKIDALARFFPVVVKFEKSDIFAMPEDHKEWELLNQHAKMIQIKPHEELKKSFDRFLNLVYTGAAMTKFGSKFRKNHPYIFHSMKLLSGAYYSMFKSKAKKVAELFYSESSHEAFGIWDIMDGKYAVPFFELTFTPIAANQVLYLPRQYPSITKEVVRKACRNRVWDDMDKPFFEKEASFPLMGSESFAFDELKRKRPHSLKIRVLCPNKLEETSLFSFCKRRKDTSIKYDKLIIHIHGGGWVGTSTAMHQIYLRHWAKMLEAPIFSVDYRLAPTHGYPDALDDCWQFYNWLLDNCQMFGVDPKNVIIAGDSAGGNMALSVSVLAHKSKRREPDGLLLAYPALNLKKNSFTPSFLKSITDQVVPFTLLELCLKEYIKDYEYADIDPLISPILHHNEMLKLLPPIQIVVGDQDPVHDECWRFLHRLVKLGKDVELTIFKDMMHGCLNFDMIMGMPEAHEVVKYCAGLIKKLIDKKESNKCH